MEAARLIPGREMRDVPRNRAADRIHRITVGKFAPQDFGTDHALNPIGPPRGLQHLSNTKAGHPVPLVQ